MLFRVASYCEVVDWNMFFCFGRYVDLVSVLVGADVNGSFLNAPNPECEGAIEDGIDGYGDGGIEFCIVETVGVVPVEASGADREGCIAKCKAGIGQGMRLREGEGVQVGGYCVVGGIFEV